MGTCQICENLNPDNISTCLCGFDMNNQEIPERISLKHLSWPKEILAKKRLCDWLSQKSSIARGAQKKAASILGLSATGVCEDIKLADAITSNPSLKKCRTKDDARKQSKQGVMNLKDPKFKTEHELRNYLSNHWLDTPFSLNWDLYAAEYDTKEIGRIDLLAKEKTGDKWLVIELKQHKSSDNTLGQILRYMGWVKHHKAEEDQSVYGVILSPCDDVLLRYALEFAVNVDFWFYSEDKTRLVIENYKNFSEAELSIKREWPHLPRYKINKLLTSILK